VGPGDGRLGRGTVPTTPYPRHLLPRPPVCLPCIHSPSSHAFTRPPPVHSLSSSHAFILEGQIKTRTDTERQSGRACCCRRNSGRPHSGRTCRVDGAIISSDAAAAAARHCDCPAATGPLPLVAGRGGGAQPPTDCPREPAWRRVAAWNRRGAGQGVVAEVSNGYALNPNGKGRIRKGALPATPAPRPRPPPLRSGVGQTGQEGTRRK
jgi:hypothetical protein